jgi:hypothetical protein
MWLNTETSYWLEKDGNHCCDKRKPVIMYSFFFFDWMNELLCLMPLLAIFQLYRGDQF